MRGILGIMGKTQQVSIMLITTRGVFLELWKVSNIMLNYTRGVVWEIWKKAAASIMLITTRGVFWELWKVSSIMLNYTRLKRGILGITRKNSTVLIT